MYKYLVIIIFLTISLPCLAHKPCKPEETRKECLERKKKRHQDKIAEIEKELQTLSTPRKKTSTNDFWISLDGGVDVVGGFYNSVGLTIPLYKKLYISGGYWFGNSKYGFVIEESGWYITLGTSFIIYD